MIVLYRLQGLAILEDELFAFVTIETLHDRLFRKLISESSLFHWEVLKFIFGVFENRIVLVNYFLKQMDNVYINIQRTVYINGIFTYLQGFCWFFGMIKFLHLCLSLSSCH